MLDILRVCKKLEISPNELMWLFCKKNNLNYPWEIPNSLAIDVSEIEDILRIDDDRDVDFEKECDNYRKKFPKDKRASKMECEEKAKKLFKVVKDITWEKINEATDRYLLENYNSIYCRKACHFLWKRENGSITYPVLDWLEREDDNYNSLTPSI